MKIAALLLAALLPVLAAAQSVHWDPPGGPLAAGETTTLQLVFEDCEPKAMAAPPKVDGLTLSFAGQSSNISLINGAYSRTITHSFAALLTKKQSVEIPSFAVETDKGKLRVPAARFDPAAATVGGGQPLESAAHSALQASPTQVWAGEVFDLLYRIQASRSYYPDFGRGMLDWNPDPLVAEDWSRPDPYEVRAGAEPQSGLVYRTRALAHKPGSYRLNPVNQLVNLSVGITGFGFFQQRQYQQFSVVSDVPTIDVRPLPPAPAGFSGAVGQFKLESKVVPEKAAVGEPITWTLELAGVGNWPDIAGFPPREISNDFQVVAPKAKKTPVEKKLFESKLTEDLVLMPTKAGRYPLRPVNFVYFDPKSGSYQNLTTGRVEVVIAPAAAAPSETPAAAASAGRPAASPPEAAVLPSGLPRDPLPEAGLASLPLTHRELAVLLLCPAGFLLLFWLGLAAARARQSDPARAGREARQRLVGTLQKIDSLAAASGAELAPALLSWQRDSAVLWGAERAAPTGREIPEAPWSALWGEADRAIYSSEAALPSGWVGRARSALAGRRAPRFSWRRVLLGRNLFPFLAAALALGASLAAVRADSSSAISPAAAYRQGDFAAAESGWREQVAARPTAWAARYNLSLALAQQDHWDESAAQAAVAFVQQPASEPARWQYALACSKAGFVPGPLAEFLVSGPRSGLASLASPGNWQRMAIAAAWLAAAALAALLARAYGLLRSRLLPGAAGVGLGLAILLFLASGFGWSAYGPAADRRAVLVWRNTTLRSVPTEADASQKTTPLGAGNLAKSDRSFLGWIRLDFDNGQTGWIRKEEAVWLWR